MQVYVERFITYLNSLAKYYLSLYEDPYFYQVVITLLVITGT